jgi:prophage regulatory protein
MEDSILRTSEVCRRTGYHRTTLWRLWRAGEFPKPRRIGKRAVGFSKAEIDAWIVAKLGQGAAIAAGTGAAATLS